MSFSQVCDQEFLKDYIIYARNNIAPEITDEAEHVLVQGYLAMRSLGGRGSKTITATPRQLESLIRISQSLAKMRLSRKVHSYDAEEAIRLMKVATQTAATDPRTGTIDMDMITTGKTATDRDLILNIEEKLAAIFSENKGQRMNISLLRNILSKEFDKNILPNEIEEAIFNYLEKDDSKIKYVQNTQTVIINS